MRDACGPSAPGEANPAVSLGAFLAAAEIEGLDRLVFFTTDSLDPVARRIGYLVGASTGKKGRGIVSIFGRPSYGLEMLQQGCLVVILKMAGEEDLELGRTHDDLRGAGVPMVTIELNGPEELAVELFKWEIATALACSQLAVDPFHDPDIREAGQGLCRYWTRSRPSLNLLHPPRAFEKEKSSYMPRAKHASRSRH
jgi:transaldolase/glucose-6-phosphate isomerase